MGLFDSHILTTVAVTVSAVFATMGVGAWSRKRGWLSPSADATLLALFVRLFLPALIVQQVLGNPALRSVENVVAPPVVAFVTVTVGFAAAAGLLVLLRRIRKLPAGLADGPSARTFVACTGIYNYGYVTLPLTLALFPPAGVGGVQDGTLGVLFVYNVGVEVAIWGVGVAILGAGSGHVGDGLWKRLTSPPIVVTVIALMLNAGDVGRLVPPVADPVLLAGRQVIGYLAAPAIPVGLLLTGATIWEDWRLCRLRSQWPTWVWASVLRVGVLPAAFVLSAAWLPLSTEVSRILVLQAAMPAAVFPIVLARHYGGDVGTALRVVVGTTLVSLVTMPVWLLVGLWVIGR